MHQKMSLEEARRFLALSREAHWAFPTSFGTPIRKDPDVNRWVEQALPKRESYANAACILLKNGDEDAATEIAANVWRLWMVERDIDGGRTFLATILDHGEKKPSRARSLALYGDALLGLRQGKTEESRERSQAALDIALVVNDREALTLGYLAMSRIAFEDGDYAKALDLAVKSREFARGMDPAMGQAPLFLHAQATRMRGEYDQAAALFEKSLDLNRKLEDPGMVMAELQNLGLVEIHRGNIDAAERYFAESENLGTAEDPYGIAMMHLYRAAIELVRGNTDGSRTLLQRAQSTLKEAGIEAAPDDQFEINWVHEQLEKNVRN